MTHDDDAFIASIVKNSDAILEDLRRTGELDRMLADPSFIRNMEASRNERHEVRNLQHPMEHHNVKDDYTPAPDPYAADLAKLRSATSTPLRDFEDRYRQERLAALDAEHRAMDAYIAAHPRPRLTTAELAEFKATDPYAVSLTTLRASTDREKLRAMRKGHE